MHFQDLEKEIDKLSTEIDHQYIFEGKEINRDKFLKIINASDYLITLHDIDLYRPLCINDNFKTFYGFKNNWFKNIDYLYYLKTIHTSTFHTLLDSIDFFKQGGKGYLNLKYKLLFKKKEWEKVLGTTKTVYRNENDRPVYAITIAKIAPAIKISFNSPTLEAIKSFTNREKEIIDYLCLGFSKKEIANHICISTSTVQTHTKNIYKKLKINKVSELINLTGKYPLD
ncbi:LuxR C-terminal-related transcriptional regulator [Flavivirga abyssicola]|uniref:response regulator transcription factor n=1 Tax=Flavivirga abyssicola TaxID=3063533 RepID=UPI0026E05366|nr:LuxR C-terminal-related transcriptional regulator [Flavivirga sp. MEBiC07777]WVK15086.1 LuxR C-terminal-related transcriptional regulator [Flavivirga sp. MEBiC07777]